MMRQVSGEMRARIIIWRDEQYLSTGDRVCLVTTRFIQVTIQHKQT